MSTAAPLFFADASIEVNGAAPLRARIYGKRARGATVPLVVHFHGGAFVDGDLESGECMAQLLVEAGYTALEWAYKGRAKLGGHGAALYLAGDEAGGNLAAAVALIARDRAHPPLAGQILIAPMLDPCVGTASLRESMQCDTGCKWAEGWQQYLRGPMDAEHPYAVPGKATRLAGLPPALVLSSADDPMRDEAMAYAARLREAGIAVVDDILPSATGWPESLAERADECPCAEPVRGHLRAFFQRATPPPA